MKRPEQTLQIAVAGYLGLALRPPTFWTSIDHGAGKMTRATAGLRKARGVKAGLQDVWVFHPMGLNTLVVVIELKAKKGNMSPAQKDAAEAMFAVNARHAECRSLDEVDRCLRRAGIPMHGTLPETTKFDQEAA